MTTSLKLADNGMQSRNTFAEDLAREFILDDGHPITILKSAINFVHERRDGQTAIGLKSASPVIVTEAYAQVRDWWRTRNARRL